MENKSPKINTTQSKDEHSLSPHQESVTLSGQQCDIPNESIAGTDTSKKKDMIKLFAPHLIRNIVADRQRLGLPGWTELEKEGIEFEETIEKKLQTLF
jgi:hypothetical protein